MLVQKWKNRESNLELVYGSKCDKGLAYNISEITTTQLYDCPIEDLESELQIMLFQFYPCPMPKA